METHSNYDADWIRKTLTKIGTFDNRWRERKVDIYEDPNNADMVYTIGYGYSEGFSDCVYPTYESRNLYKKWIGRFDGVAL